MKSSICPRFPPPLSTSAAVTFTGLRSGCDLQTLAPTSVPDSRTCTYMLRCGDLMAAGSAFWLLDSIWSNMIQSNMQKKHEASRHEFGCCMLSAMLWIFCHRTKPLLEILVQSCATLCFYKYVSDVIGQTWGVWDTGFHEVLWWRVCAHSEGQAAAAWALQISAAESHSKRSQRSRQKEDLFCVFPRPVVHWFGQGKLDGTTDCP